MVVSVPGAGFVSTYISSPAGYPFFSIPRKLQHDLKIPLSGPQQYLLEVGALVKEQIDCE